MELKQDDDIFLFIDGIVDIDEIIIIFRLSWYNVVVKLLNFLLLNIFVLVMDKQVVKFYYYSCNKKNL